MKAFNIIFIIVAIGLIIFNITKINFEAPFSDDSITALTTILAALCAIILLQILRFSKKIVQNLKQNN